MHTSLLNELPQLLEFVNSEVPDIVYVTETWLSDSVPDEQYSILGYKLLRKDRDLSLYDERLFRNKAREGFLIYVK